ncbi:uncharacterized protein J3D65DRAFT_81975 [Phyllosticta citribraziliensis]|uniref:Uncharacterized protein n=1 Tax=Phyllosticta citribraziliensis TaxID=989973 RepID=A0ABR1L9U0_9PEZI
MSDYESDSDLGPDGMKGFYDWLSWKGSVTRFVSPGEGGEPEDYDLSRCQNPHKGPPFRFLDLPKDVRLLIYELVLGSQIIRMGYYYSIYSWNMGRCFYFTAPRLGGGLVVPEDHLDLRNEYRGPYASFIGSPPHPATPWLELSLLSVCRQIHEEAREIPFRKNIFVPLGAKCYDAFFQRIMSPIQSGWIRFLTIVVCLDYCGPPKPGLWYGTARSLPNLASVHFVIKIDFTYDWGDVTYSPAWWADDKNYDSECYPLLAEDVHKIPNLFRLLAHSNADTKVSISIDDTAVTRRIRNPQYGVEDMDDDKHIKFWMSRVKTLDKPFEKQLAKDGLRRGTLPWIDAYVMKFLSLTEADKKIYVDEFQRRLTERPTILQEKVKEAGEEE